MRPLGTISKSVLMGMVAAFGLLAIYFLILTLVSGRDFALSQFFEFWPFVMSLAAGFGVQIGLYRYLKNAAHQHCASGKVLAVSGPTSTTAMISCCAHYLMRALAGIFDLRRWLTDT